MAPAVIKDERASVTEGLFEPEPQILPAPNQLPLRAKAEHRVEVGDTVRVRYLTDDKRIIKITISNTQSDPSHGIVHHRTPVASALLGAEAGDEVEILVGSYIRPAIIEGISKSNGESPLL
jgi:transcription elongation GreA/GreB family factor